MQSPQWLLAWWDTYGVETKRKLSTLAVTVTQQPTACCSAWRSLIDLHRERRTSLSEKPTFDDRKFYSFHETAIQPLGNSGQLQIRVLRLDGEPVAAEHVLQDQSALFAYQSGMSGRGETESAGNLSILAMIRDAIASGRRRVDLLRGNEPYKFS
jgi:CelD/BcsL family acetyltransferase involved in cellulose biosynthesis